MVIFKLDAVVLASKHMSCCFTIPSSRQADVMQTIGADGAKNSLVESIMTRFVISQAFPPGIRHTLLIKGGMKGAIKGSSQQ